MKDLEYYHQIADILKNLRDNNPYSRRYTIESYVKALNSRKSIFDLSTEYTDFVSGLVLSNYHKISEISNSPNINNNEKLNIISSFVFQTFNWIIKAINNSTNDFNEKIKSGLISYLDLKSSLKKILERNIELILILKNFEVNDEVENFLNKEAKNIFEFAELQDVKILSRKYNLKLYLTTNIDSLLKVDTKSYVVCYSCVDSSFSLIDCSGSDVDQAKGKVKNVTNWKPFRTKARKQIDLENATYELKKEVERLKEKRADAKSILKKEIKQMEDEIDKLEPYSETKQSDFIKSKIPNASITSLKQLAKSRIRKFLEERLNKIDSPYDLYNITLVQNDLISTIESYRYQYKVNKNELQLTDTEIENMFNELLTEIQKEYFN